MPLRDARNFVARSFSSHDTLRSISCAMRVNSSAVSSVVRIITCASFVALSDAGLPALLFFAMFTSAIIVNGVVSGVNRKFLLATLRCLFVTRCKHSAYNFRFPLSEKYAQILLDIVNGSRILFPESEDTMNDIKYLELNEMLAVLDEAKKVSARNHAIVLFAFRFGLRASELALLKVSDIEGGYCDVQRLKGSEHTRQQITRDPNPLLDVKAALAACLREREDSGSVFLFTSRLGSGMTRRAIYNVFEDAAFHAGIDAGRRNIHIAKHSLAVNLRKRGVPVDIVQKALGHSRPETTIKFYYHTSQDEATAAIGKAFAAA